MSNDRERGRSGIGKAQTETTRPAPSREPNAEFFGKPIEATPDLLVPTLSIYEVFKRVLQQRGEGDALQAVAVMQPGTVVDLTPPVALAAARISLDVSIPMADSVMLATSRAWNATLWTQDADFENLPGVRYIAKRNRPKGR